MYDKLNLSTFLKMQAPAISKNEYKDIIIDTLSSAETLISFLEKYPKAPTPSIIQRYLADASRQARRDDFMGARATLGRLLHEEDSVFQFDARDACLRGLLRNCQQLIRITYQNTIDNALKAASATKQSNNPRRYHTVVADCNAMPCSARARVYKDGNARERYQFRVQQTDFTDNPSGQEFPINRPQQNNWRGADKRAKSRDRFTTEKSFQNYKKNTPKFKSTSNISNAYPNLKTAKLNASLKDETDMSKLLDDINQIDLDELDDWTPRDEEQFDHETYYGSSTWFLE